MSKELLIASRWSCFFEIQSLISPPSWVSCLEERRLFFLLFRSTFTEMSQSFPIIVLITLARLFAWTEGVIWSWIKPSELFIWGMSSQKLLLMLMLLLLSVIEIVKFELRRGFLGELCMMIPLTIVDNETSSWSYGLVVFPAIIWPCILVHVRIK